MGTRDDKSILREECAKQRAAVTGEERRAAEEKIGRYISQLVSYRHAGLLLFYMPIKSETDVLPLIVEALRRGRSVALPRCERTPGEMTFRYVSSLDELSPGAFGVREPSEDAPEVPADLLKGPDGFLIVPGLAFDKSGCRLGYGKGYYDRFLSRFGGFSAGVCFSELLYDELPHGRFDRRVNAVITERGVTLCHA